MQAMFSVATQKRKNTRLCSAVRMVLRSPVYLASVLAGLDAEVVLCGAGGMAWLHGWA
jgi:hypothetical protein